MIFFGAPSKKQIEDLLETAGQSGFSYPQVGATRGDASPSGYALDCNRVKLGSGESVFEKAAEAIRRWIPFDLGWVRIHASGEPVPGLNVCVEVNLWGIRVLNGCRVVYCIDSNESGSRRFGFAYGTLARHVESGEERFVVEWDRKTGVVHYEILAFSKPKWFLVRLGYPVARLFQKRFARDSARRMQRVFLDRQP